MNRRPDGVRGSARGAAPVALLLVVLLAVLTLASSGTASAAGRPPAPAALPATAADPGTPALEIRVTSVQPAALTPQGTLVVTGSVTNRGAGPLHGVRVELAVSSQLLSTRSAVAEWAARTPDQLLGQRYPPAVQPTPASAPLAVGAALPFTLSVSAAALGWSQGASDFGPHGVSVIASGDDESGTANASVARTFVVWDPPAHDYTPTRLSVLVPLTTTEAGSDAAVAGTQLRSELAPTGRLSRLLTGSLDPAISLAVDPAVAAAALGLESAAGSAAGGSGGSGTGAGTGTGSSPGASTGSGTTASTGATTPAGGSGSALPVDAALAASAKSWLDRLASARSGQDVLALPFADPDVAALAHGGIGADALLQQAYAQARTSSQTTLGTALTSPVSWPVGGCADAATVALLDRVARGRPIVLAGSCLSQAAEGTASAPSLLPAVGTTALVADDVLSSMLAAVGGAQAATATQRTLAELAVVTASSSGQPRHLLVTAPRGWNVDPTALQAWTAALHAASWVGLDRLSTLATQRPASDARRPRLVYPAQQRDGELSGSVVHDVLTSFRQERAFTSALTRPQDLLAPLDTSVLSLTGQAWRAAGRARPDGQAGAVRSLAARVTALYGGIEVLNGKANLLTVTGPLPVTVQNKLSQAVKVQLRMRTRTGRLIVGPPVMVTIEAGRTKQLAVPVRAVANGDVEIEASLWAPDGQLLVTAAPVQVRVRAEWEGRGLGTAAFALAALLVAGLVRSVRRGRRTLPPDSAPDPDDVGDERLHRPRRTGRRTPQPAAPSDHDGEAAPGDPSQPPPPSGPGTPLPPPLLDPRTYADDRFEPRLAPVGTFAPPRTGAVALQDGELRVHASSLAEVGPAGAGRDEPTSARPASQAPDRPGDVPPARAGSQHGSPQASTSGVMRNSAVMAAGTLVSRVLGQVRASTLGWAIGGAVSADVFTTANTLPNSFYILLSGGVLNAVLVPQIVRADQRADGAEYVDRLLTVSLAVLFGATVLVTALAAPIYWFYNQGAPQAQLDLGTAFALWCLPQMFFYGLYTLYGQVLNARGSFGPYMWAPVLANVVTILGILAFVLLEGSGAQKVSWWTAGRVALLAGTATLGIVAQAMVLLPVLRRTGFRWRPRWGLRGVGLRSASRVAGWTFAAAAVGQLGLVVISNVTNRAGDLALAAHEVPVGRWVYDQAFLLFILPHSLVTVSLVTAVFTRMSAAAAAGRVDAVRADLSLAVRTTGVATVAATAAIMVLGRDITSVLFAGNSLATTDGLALVTIAMALGLVPFSAQYLFQRVFYAFEDARTPFLVTVLAVAVWTVGNLAALWLLPTGWITVGVGLAMTVGNAVGAGASIVLLRRRIGSLDGARVLRTHARLVVAAVLAGAAAWALDSAMHTALGHGRISALLSLLVSGSAMLAVYGVLLRVMRVQELSDLLAPVLRRASGRVGG